jgi:uncharacterized protein (TIGR00725 family)
MKRSPRIGVMGSAGTISDSAEGLRLRAAAQSLGSAIGKRQLTLFTGATTGLVYEVGKTARNSGALHIGISPGSSRQEHVERYNLPTDACDEIVFTGFGLKGRNVVLVRSCEIVLFISGGMGSLNEFTIAHDEGRIIGCFVGTGGVADDAEYLLRKFSAKDRAQIICETDCEKLLDACINRWRALEP